MKKVLAFLFAAAMLFGLVACGRGTTPASSSTDPSSGDSSSTPVAQADYKIGVITGTVSQGEEEFQAAQNMVAKYGDKIVTATYPDNFSTETETVIAQVQALASDPDVKAIVFVQAVPGAVAAMEKVRETRPDMLFIAGVAAEAPRDIAAAADIVMLVDEIGMGTTVPEQAAKQGAKTFIHYSFPRHLGYETIAARHKLMKEACAKLNIQFVDVTAPDPTGDAGVSGAQQFILEDVPRQVEKYGKDTAFFSTNCSMMEPLIQSVLKEGAIFPQQCCPSPYHGYPGALNLSVAGHEGDVQYMLDQITSKVEEGGNAGRMSTWALPVNMLMIEAGVEYAIQFCEGKTTAAFDDAAIRASIENIAANEYQAEATISNFEDTDGTIENFYMILCSFYDF